MSIWRIHLRPGARSTDPVKFCIDEGIVGIGWRVSTKPKDFDTYYSLGKHKHVDSNGWKRAANAIGRKIAIGDLVWVRDFYGVYYIGMVEGDWQYYDSQDSIEADISNGRPCKLHKVGSNIAGKIINCFRPSATVQRIHDATAELFSISVFNQITSSNISIPVAKSTNIYSLLSDIDLEDVIGLYLQHTKGLIFVPSSRSRQNSTIFYEFQLIDPNSGLPSYVQVKSGNIMLDPRKYYGFPDTIYLFSPSGYTCKSQKSHVICIDIADINTFLAKGKKLLPFNISTWITVGKQLNVKP